ncbi:MAG: helix-hairpin-helix domain-containing protein [Anaerolineae bacterium]|nr:helix-hairpin-helix domain-containing protein [Anaerolineae bacterium]
MDVVPSTLIDVDELREEIREQVQAQVRKQYCIYGLVLTVLLLVVMVVIGMATTRERTQPSDILIPPPYWGQVCVPATVADAIVSRPTVTPQPLRIYVSGAVEQPGVVTVPAGSLLADALDAAGGAADDADMDSINLAALLVDNQHVIVPHRAATLQPEGTASGSSVDALVNINTATAAELEMLPHIGPAMAQRIIDYREAHGPFERIEDVQEVDGIGETRYKDLAPLITVGP